MLEIKGKQILQSALYNLRVVKMQRVLNVQRVLSMSRVLSVDRVLGTQIVSWIKGVLHM